VVFSIKDFYRAGEWRALAPELLKLVALGAAVKLGWGKDLTALRLGVLVIANFLSNLALMQVLLSH
jgi:hypothetical protein